MRIVSLLPSATEICFALGLGEQVVAVTHECDYPPEAKSKPRITQSLVDSDRLTGKEIDIAISERVRRGEGIYSLNENLLQELRPDLILTQELCAVCAVSFTEVQQAARELPRCEVVNLEPTCIAEILRDIERVGDLTGSSDRAREFASLLQRRVGSIGLKTVPLNRRPRVFCMEWLDPPYCAGHWVPEMVEVAGGTEVLGLERKDSTRVSWEAIVRSSPEIIVMMPCGFDRQRTVAEHQQTRFPGEWRQLPAVRNRNVYATDANAYFSRCGPRIVDGIAILAEILQPDLFQGVSPPDSWIRLS